MSTTNIHVWIEPEKRVFILPKYRFFFSLFFAFSLRFDLKNIELKIVMTKKNENKKNTQPTSHSFMYVVCTHLHNAEQPYKSGVSFHYGRKRNNQGFFFHTSDRDSGCYCYMCVFNYLLFFFCFWVLLLASCRRHSRCTPYKAELCVCAVRTNIYCVLCVYV